MRPVIGITTYVEPASWSVWHDLRHGARADDYVAAVTEAGGRAVLLPPDDLDADVLRVLDGLVLSGGADVDPELYGARPEPLTDTRPDRDSGELLLARAALARDLPVLGVCRGMQLLAVAAGGTLPSTCPTWWGTSGIGRLLAVYGKQEVSFVAGSRIGALMGDDRVVRCTTIRGSLIPAHSMSPGARTTAVSRRSRTRHVGSSSACNGIPKSYGKRLFGALPAAGTDWGERRAAGTHRGDRHLMG